jgi:hypothetical protein
MLELPSPLKGSVAVLESGFRPGPGTRDFDIVVAPLQEALALAEKRLRGLIAPPSPRVAIVVWTRVDSDSLTAHHRDLLWRAFGVPVFEQIRDAEGQVIARECEVHDGLHMDRAYLPESFGTEIVTGQCECGSESPRLRKRPPLRRMAAAAAA